MQNRKDERDRRPAPEPEGAGRRNAFTNRNAPHPPNAARSTVVPKIATMCGEGAIRRRRTMDKPERAPAGSAVRTEQPSRRNFVAAATAAAAIPLRPILEPRQSAAEAGIAPFNGATRMD